MATTSTSQVAERAPRARAPARGRRRSRRPGSRRRRSRSARAALGRAPSAHAPAQRERHQRADPRSTRIDRPIKTPAPQRQIFLKSARRRRGRCRRDGNVAAGSLKRPEVGYEVKIQGGDGRSGGRCRGGRGRRIAARRHDGGEQRARRRSRRRSPRSGSRRVRTTSWRTTRRSAAYFHQLDNASDRMQVVSLGQTSEGRDQVMGIVSAPENLTPANLAKYQDIANRLAHARGHDRRPGARPRQAGQGDRVGRLRHPLHRGRPAADRAAVRLRPADVQHARDEVDPQERHHAVRPEHQPGRRRAHPRLVHEVRRDAVPGLDLSRALPEVLRARRQPRLVHVQPARDAQPGQRPVALRGIRSWSTTRTRPRPIRRASSCRRSRTR